MDSGFRRDDRRLHPIVIPAKAGIQWLLPKTYWEVTIYIGKIDILATDH